MLAAEKYVIRIGGKAITKKARRADAHRLRTLLGSRYEVWNTVTRQRSLQADVQQN